ncbi:HEPN domain-containing protein [Mucilaginibacter sp.]|uniref:HEPN domain-containing protein n=1 Tax=Mucilaginibacter sp. TaxID=1882438 RepID=UPI002626F120|nr:HEPN domain-containing protein [Mucilaginibacter sp.]MDB4921343.1 hypothetical protein [Mucilaginibacter sp.]
MDEELRPLFWDFVKEFFAMENSFMNNFRISRMYRTGYYIQQGVKRDAQQKQYLSGTIIDQPIFCMVIANFIYELSSTKRIYEYFANNKLWIEDFKSYEECQNYIPSMISKIAGGFLFRNFEINNYQFIVTESSFDIALKELIAFFNQDFVSYDQFIHVKKVSGDLNEAILTNQVSLVQADYEMAKFYSINYSRPEPIIELELYEGDYLLKVKSQIPKDYYTLKKIRLLRDYEMYIRDKWKYLPILGISGYLELGKIILNSFDWPIMNYRVIGPFGNEHYHLKNETTAAITDERLQHLQYAANIISDTESFKDLDKRILYSIERLTKSKAAKNIDDRVVDLAIAFEYLINTEHTEVTLQLCLKVLKLLDDNNKDDKVFDSLKKFYALRSKVVHGNDKIPNNAYNTSIIDLAELIVQKATLRMIILNKVYSFPIIDKALKKAIYISKPLSDLLVEANLPN